MLLAVKGVGGAIALARSEELLHPPATANGRKDANEGLGLQEANHRHAVILSIQVESAYCHLEPSQGSKEPLQHIEEGIIGTDIGQGQCDAFVLADDIGCGIDVEVSGAAFGPAMADFPLVLVGLTMVRDQNLIDGHLMIPANDSGRQMFHQGLVQGFLQFCQLVRCLRQSLIQLFTNLITTGAILELLTGALNGAPLRTSGHKHPQYVQGFATVAVNGQVQMLCQCLNAQFEDLFRCDSCGILINGPRHIHPP